MLQEGSVVEVEGAGVTARVGRLLGEGTQGAVFVSELSGHQMALKWYKPDYLPLDPGLRDRLAEAIRLGAPSPSFLWPIALASAPGLPTFGYLMPLRESRFVEMRAVMAGQDGGQPVRPTFRSLMTAGLELAGAFNRLHSLGLCYRDISFENIFIDPKSGEICICDNDNVDTNGAKGVVGGTPTFMAPEIVRGEAAPTTKTDLFSLAVLLFQLLLKDHPLEGTREYGCLFLDMEEKREIYGTSPVFIFDPKDRSNPPHPTNNTTAPRYWPVLPRFLCEVFVRTFTAGLRDPDARPLENEWRSIFARARDAIVYCPCRTEAFYDADLAARQPNWAPRCWHCGRPVPLPPRLVFEAGGVDGGAIVMLNQDARIFPHHTGIARYDFSKPAAEVARHPRRPDVWGLRNLSDEKWTATPPGGGLREVAPGQAVLLAPGTRLNFGRRMAEIRI